MTGTPRLRRDGSVDVTFWQDRRVLVTGHTGFKGAWLCLWLERLGAAVAGLALPPESDRGAYASLGPWQGPSYLIDLREAVRVNEAVQQFEPEIVLHLAAEAIVRRGYRDPAATFATNVMGTIHLLEAIRRTPSVSTVVVVTSDKVYADASARPAVEGDRLGHPDPYSSSKACTELVVDTWRRSYLEGHGIAIATARAGNVIGGGDDAPDRLVPDVLRAQAGGQEVLIRSPYSIRPWQHVLDPLHGYLLMAEQLYSDPGSCPSALNFGPIGTAWTVEDVVRFLHEELGGGRVRLATDPATREAPALLLDSSLAGRTLGWLPLVDTPDALRWTAAWHLEQRGRGAMRRFSTEQIRRFQERASNQQDAH
jgi:CDP-glucose 4,6-dehydratase